MTSKVLRRQITKKRVEGTEGAVPRAGTAHEKKKRERVGLVRPDLSDQQHSSPAKPRPGDILNSNQSDKQVLLLQKR